MTHSNDTCPTPTLDRLIIVTGPQASGKTLNAGRISEHFDKAPVFDDLYALARDYQFEDFVSAILLASIEIPSVTHQPHEHRFLVKHYRKLVYAREVRLETVDSLRGNIFGWIDPTPDEKIG